MNYDVGVIVGRFQVAELHEEHIRLIEQVYNEHPKTIIFLGVSRFKTTKNNPLDFEARRAMLEVRFPKALIAYIPDYRTNEEWSNDLDNQIMLLTGPNSKPILYGGRDSFVRHYTGRFPTSEIKPERYVSGSECRQRIGEAIKRSPDFREGVIWATQNQYTRIFPTVDITVKVESEILVARKPGEDKYRFVGGFQEIDSVSAEEDAVRELREEASILTVRPESLKYVCSLTVDDWRTAGEKEKIKTTFFLAELVEKPEIKAGDDVSHVEFVNLNELDENSFVRGHKPLLRKLKDFILATN